MTSGAVERRISAGIHLIDLYMFLLFEGDLTLSGSAGETVSELFSFSLPKIGEGSGGIDTSVSPSIVRENCSFVHFACFETASGASPPGGLILAS